MEGFRKCVSFLAGVIAFFTFIAFMVVDDHLSKWTLVKTYIIYNDETSILSKSQTPQYYILLNTSGTGNNETDYIDLENQNCSIVRIQQPNKKFYNQAIFSKKTYYIFNNGGVTKPENFNGYIQYGEKAYTLEEFYENPPFEGDIDPLGSENMWGWITLGLVAICLIGLIPVEEFEFTLPNTMKEKKVRKAAAEIFPHLEHVFKVEKLKVINFITETVTWKISIDHDDRTIYISQLGLSRDGMRYNYKTKEVSLQDKYDLQVALAFIKLKPKLQPLYNGILDYAVETVVDKIPPSDEIQISL